LPPEIDPGLLLQKAAKYRLQKIEPPEFIFSGLGIEPAELMEKARHYRQQPSQVVSPPKRGVSRRWFLRLGAATATGVAAAALFPSWRSSPDSHPAPDTAPVAEALVEAPEPVITRGRFNGEPVEVIRPTGKGSFIARDQTGVAPIPMQSLVLEPGNLSWAKEIEKPLEWLGFDYGHDKEPARIDKIPQMGAGMVRIPVEDMTEKFLTDHQIPAAVKAAREKNLKIILMFNPGGLLQPSDLRLRVHEMLKLVAGYDNVAFELGNDADWEVAWDPADNRTLNKFARFVAETSGEIERIRPHAQIIIGAVRPDHFLNLIGALSRSRQNVYKFTYALHAYNTIASIDEAVAAVKLGLGSRFEKFIFTELGYNKKEEDKGQKIVELVEHARKKGAREIIIFQLRNIEFPDEKGLWGIVSPEGEWEQAALPVIDWLWNETHPQGLEKQQEVRRRLLGFTGR